MKKFWIGLLCLFCFTATTVVLAGDDPSTPVELSEIFTKPEKDIATEYLGSIFGKISDGLDEKGLTSSSRLWWDIFRYFNHIALVVGLFLLFYTVVVGTLQTATSGKILGEKWSGTWLPIRSVAGISLLLPTSSGYCLAQVMVMWVVFWGSTAASTLWSSTLDYLDSSPLYTSADSNTEDLQKLHTSMGNAKKLLVGAYGSLACNALYNKQSDDEEFTYRRSKSGDERKAEYFGYQDRDKGYGLECGDIVVDNELQLNEVHKLLSIIRPIADKADKIDSSWPELKLTPEERNAVTIAWKALPDTIRNAKNMNRPDTSSTLRNLKEYGWIVAGSYYRQLGKTSAGDSGEVSEADYAHMDSKSLNHTYAIYQDSNYLSIRKKIQAGETLFDKTLDNILDEVKGNSKGTSNAKDLYDQSSKFDAPKLSGWWYTLGLKRAFFELTKPILDALGGTFNTPGDPFASAVDLGNKMMTAAAAIVTTALLIGNAIFATAANICRAQNPAGAGAHTVQSTISATILGVAGFLYTQGVMLAIYLPLIPFIIFVVGVVGWLICVFEAVVAAPLVAIGLIWPDAQNEILGRAEPAVMLVLNLFLRPSLMIMGLVAGTLVCWVAFQLTNLGFRTMLSNGDIGYEATFGWLALGFIYAMLLIAIAKKSYSLIHHVPDKVLHWIGDNSQGVGGADEIVNATQGGADKGTGSIGGFASGVGQHVGYGGSDITKSYHAYNAVADAIKRKNNEGNDGELSSS